MLVEIEKTHDDVPTPAYATSASAGFDLTNQGDTIELVAGQVAVIPTGIKVKLPVGTVGMLTPRSGKSISGFSVNNSPGIIDQDYRNEIKVIAIHNGIGTVKVERGERIAQLVIVPYIQAQLQEVEELSADEANDRTGGLGSTGKF
jgi:dUTP pyrophosphatase